MFRYMEYVDLVAEKYAIGKISQFAIEIGQFKITIKIRF